MYDSPSADELLDAVGEFLSGEVANSLPPERRFQALVAANACRIARRELASRLQDATADRDLFARLLALEDASSGEASDDHQLAVRLAATIRRGTFDKRLDELAMALRAHVDRKLSISNPGYSGRS